MESYLNQCIDTTKEVQRISEDGHVRVTYHHWDFGMKYRVQVNTGSKNRPRWYAVGYSDSYHQALETFNRIVSDRKRGVRA